MHEPGRRLLTATLALALLTALPAAPFGGPAWAVGPQLRWNECAGSGGAERLRSFACNTSDGFELLVPSLVLPAPFPALIAAEAKLRVLLDGGSVPQWWRMRTGECRANAVHAMRSVTASWSGCHDPWPASAVFVAGASVPLSAPPNQIQLQVVMAVPAADSFTTRPADGALYLGTIVVNHASTTGAGACAGCGTRACLVLDTVGLYAAPGGPFTSYAADPFAPDDAVVLWQPTGPLDACPGIVPTQNRTWGAIKSLYR